MYYYPFITSESPNPTWPASHPVPGLLPRKTRYGEVFPTYAQAVKEERVKLVPRAEWDKWKKSNSLRPFVKTVLDQDGVGSCATEGTAQAVMIARAVAGLPHVPLNPWFIYHTTSGGRDSGSSIDENLQFVMANGCAPMDVWGRDKGWRATPSSEAVEAAKEFKGIEVFDIASIDEMVSALLTGFAVVWGANSHCVTKVEHLDESKGLDINSWGTSWGDGGFGTWTSYRGIQWGYGAWALRVPSYKK